MTDVVFVGKLYYSDLRPDQGLPGGQGGHPSQPIYNPAYPDQGLPGGQGGRPSQPIYYPPYPDQGLPGGSGGHPSHPIHQPGQPSHPIHIPGVPDQGLPPGQPIPPEQVGPPALPEGHEDDLVVAVKQPNSTEWTYTAYDVQPDQGQPTPTPHRRG